MRRLMFIFITCFLPMLTHAQWRQMQDTLLMHGAFSYVCPLGKGMVAGTKSGVYYSDRSDFHWKHVSPFYCDIKNLFLIDSTLYVDCVIQDYERLLRSNDKGYHWDTVFIVTSSVNQGFALAGNTIIYKGINALFSNDKGDSWHSYSNPYFDTYYSDYGNLSNGIMGAYKISGNDSSAHFHFFYSTDGFHFNEMLDSSFPAAKFMGAMFVGEGKYIYTISMGWIFEFDTVAKTTKYIGVTPGLEFALFRDQDSSFSLNFLYKVKNTFYIGYVNVFTNTMLVFSSIDTQHWEKLVEIKRGRGSFGTALAPYSQLLVIDADSVDISIDSATVMPIVQTGIASSNMELRQVDSTFMQAFDPFRLSWVSIKKGTEARSFESGADEQELNRYTRYAQAPHPALSSGRVVSHSAGYIFYNGGDNQLYFSNDTGRSWKDITYNYNFSIGSVEKAIVYKGSYLVLQRHQNEIELLPLYLDTVKKEWNWLGQNINDYFIAAMDTTPQGIPVVLGSSRSTMIYYYSDSLNKWVKAEKKGLFPGGNTYIMKGNYIFAFSYRGLYVSRDLGHSFVKDSSFPASLSPYLYHIGEDVMLDNFGMIDSALYVSTNAGIWYTKNYYTAPRIIAPPGPGIKKEEPSADIKVYPDPVTDKINIAFNDSSDRILYIQLTDMAGRICRNIENVSVPGQNLLVIDRAGLRKGMYILKITGAYTKTMKLVLE